MVVIRRFLETLKKVFFPETVNVNKALNPRTEFEKGSYQWCRRFIYESGLTAEIKNVCENHGLKFKNGISNLVRTREVKYTKKVDWKGIYAVVIIDSPNFLKNRSQFEAEIKQLYEDLMIQAGLSEVVIGDKTKWFNGQNKKAFMITIHYLV